MKDLIVIMIAWIMLIGVAPSVMAKSFELDQAWKRVMEQQKKQEARWKALEDEAAKLFKQGNKDIGPSNKKSR